MTYQESLDFLYSQLPMFQRVGKTALNHDLRKTIELHDQIGNPQHKFKSIHIAGTNGKGSTAHYLTSILMEAGYKVGLYTSPHLKSFRERIKINGKMVSEQFVVDFVTQSQAMIKEIQPSFFEMTVAMAYDCFAKERVDIAVIETGLGGRLDSTNIIMPEVSVITSIGLDHKDILGDTVEAIALEKAGIIKNKVPVVLGSMESSCLEVMEQVAKEKSAPVYYPSKDYHVNEEEGRITIEKKGVIYFEKIDSDLKGESSLLNLSTVLGAVDVLNSSSFDISTKAAENGIVKVCQNTGLLGRWQVISNNPLTICDIGHNESAVDLLMKRLMTFQKNMHIVWGMNKDKSIDEVLALLPKDATYYFCAAKIDRAMPSEKLKEMGARKGLQGESFNSINQAVKTAMNGARNDEVVFIGGSTFVVAEIEDLI